jgi:protein ImuB
MPLPPAALRLEHDIVTRLQKLGLNQIGSFMRMPRSALRRRFGPGLLLRLDQALGQEPESFQPIQPLQPYQERLPCLEPIVSATGIEIALRRLLEALCGRLEQEAKGLRTCVLKGYRVDGVVQQIDIGTNRPSRNVEHLFRLFDLKICQLEPDLGFELFILEAPIVEELSPLQEMLWNTAGTGDETAVAELLDRVAGKIGMNAIHRYLPDEHYWPERSVKLATSLDEAAQTTWRTDRPRPVHLLPRPERIEVMVRIPDYPPVHFIYRGKLCQVVKADGPERIEEEWWLEEGQHRDYYCVEDEDGARYWLFRLGHYDNNEPHWFMHGFFA